MAQAEKRPLRPLNSGKRISTVDQALEAMGGEDRVATWLQVHPHEMDDMRRRGKVERGWFAHFYVTLTALGHTPEPKLFGLKGWRDLTMPGVRRVL
jgi:hypothetical protein